MHTKIIDETSPEYASALEDLLVGFAHGDSARVHQALGMLGHGPEMARVHTRVHDMLTSFHTTMWLLRRDFDPASVGMSSTNIPDAITKLESVLQETSKATHDLFGLLNQQEELVKQGEALLNDLESETKKGTPRVEAVSEFITKYREINAAVAALSTTMVMTQEFQDLCGQRIQKVIKLVKDLETNLTSLLGQLKVPMPQPPAVIPEGQTKVDQSDIDDILNGSGL